MNEMDEYQAGHEDCKLGLDFDGDKNVTGAYEIGWFDFIREQKEMRQEEANDHSHN